MQSNQNPKPASLTISQIRHKLAKEKEEKEKIAKAKEKEEIERKESNAFLFELIENNNVDYIKLLLETGDPKPDINSKNEKGDTPLIQAAKNPNFNDIQVLLDYKAEINLPSSFGSTALMWAANLGSLNSLKTLLEKKALVNLQNSGMRSALWYAIEYNRGISFVEALINANADVNMMNDHSGTPLHTAVKKDNRDIAETLIEAKANLTIKNNTNRTPYEEAKYRGSKKCKQLLKDKKPKKYSLVDQLFKPHSKTQRNNYREMVDEEMSQLKLESP